MRLKILYICYEDMSGYNGAIRHITEVIKGLCRNGYRIDLCAPKLGKKPSVLSKETNVELRYVPTVPLQKIRPLIYLFLSLFYLPWLYLLIKPDIVYIRDIEFTPFPVILSKILKIPSILEVNALTDELVMMPIVGARTFFIFDAIRRWNLKKTDHIITVTKGIKKEITHGYGIAAEKISIISNGVNLKEFRPINKTEAIEKTGLSQSYCYVGFVGGLFPWHGLDQLVRAAPHILKKKPHARFVIVGSGLMEAELKIMIAKRKLQQQFIFTGIVPFQEVPYYINCFDVCVVFFKKVRKDPGDPIKLYEYLACGRPVIASNVPGYGDVVESIEAGISVNSEDPIAIAEGILELLKNDKKAEILQEKSIEKARACFSWEKKVEDTEKVMKELLMI
ncbi:MAG: glycosyltransferase family 4 protein [Candidatus Aminicenantes bacterium]|nr:MAG: glycosyltransferase family 4 protein [Candidatus Aminicenantes bacterium]